MVDSGERFSRRYKYYEILEISKNATQEEIKKAFRRLAQKWHPDRNPGNSGAEAKFKKINEAYQVLSNSVERAAYDTSQAECPVCWTHEVIQISGNNWRCRYCGCQFDVLGSLLSETIERAAISERYRSRLTAFQSMQCSWCRRFFTQPFLCPYRLQLHSSCFFFDSLSGDKRGRLLDDEKW
jgi:curved DNA-binding protein CbpA